MPRGQSNRNGNRTGETNSRSDSRQNASSPRSLGNMDQDRQRKVSARAGRTSNDKRSLRNSAEESDRSE